MGASDYVFPRRNRHINREQLVCIAHDLSNLNFRKPQKSVGICKCSKLSTLRLVQHFRYHLVLTGLLYFLSSLIPGNFVRSPQSNALHLHLAAQLSQHMCIGCGKLDVPSKLQRSVFHLQSLVFT